MGASPVMTELGARRRGDAVSWDEILAGPRLTARLFVPFCLIGLAIFLTWANFAELDEVARGGGRVVPSTQVQVVQNLEGGILSELLVREGQKVTRGQVLVRIDDTSAGSNYREQRARYLGLLASIARLDAEIGGGAPKFPAEVLAEPGLAEREIQLLQSRRDLVNSSVAALRQETEQRQREIAELESRVAALSRSAALSQEELRVTEPLFQQGAVSKVEILRLQREVNDLIGNLNSSRLLIGKARAALAGAEQRVAEKIGAFRSDSLAQLSENKVKLKALQETQSAAEDRVARTEVRAPVDGIVKRMHISTVGGVIKPGADILEIVPVDDRLLIEAKVSPNDIAYIRTGQDVLVKLTAYDFALYGGLPGEVEQIAADSIVDDNGNVTYQVWVRTREARLGRSGRDVEIIPGMVAEIDIITGKKTILQYLLKPVLRARDYGLRER